MQTSDTEVYLPFLRVTARPNRAWCERQGMRYVARLGIERGCHPWHATFNRIPILNEYLDAGFRGWVLYLDADAYVADLGADIRGFLAARSDRSLVGALGHNKSLADLNAGVVFFNFAHADTPFVLREWQRSFEAEVTDSMLAAAPEGWSFRPNDQDLLQRILRDNMNALWPGIGLEERSVLNGPEARLVRQVLRKDAGSMAERIAIAERDIARIMGGDPALPVAA